MGLFIPFIPFLSHSVEGISSFPEMRFPHSHPRVEVTAAEKGAPRQPKHI
jgi:hypothetical protein